MVNLRPAEYITRFDSDDIPAPSSAWTMTAPNATVYSETITNAGIVSITSGGVAGDSAVFIGLDGLKWSPTISNGGVVTLTQSTALSSSDLVATLVDSDSVTWIFYVGDDGQARVTTASILPTPLRYPAFQFSYTPSLASDICLLHSTRLNLNERRRAA
jgi:hypothetical protein